MIFDKLFRRFRADISCDEVMAVLQSYLDGEVDATTARRVAGHLHACTDCGPESEVYRRIKTSLASAEAPVDPEVLASLRSFSERLMAGEIDESTR